MKEADISNETIFSLLRNDRIQPQRRSDWWWLSAIGLTAWVGATVFLGQYRPNQVARIFTSVAAADTIFLGTVGVAVLFAVGALAAGRREFAGAAAIVSAFLLGHLFYEWVYVYLPGRFVFPLKEMRDGFSFALARLSYAATILVPMLIVWAAVIRRRGASSGLVLGFGNLGAPSRDLSAKAPLRPIWRELVGGYFGFWIILFAIMQMTVGFRPITGGRLWALFPAVLIAAAANAFAEEILFRGVIQPAFIRAGGIAAGLWVQGMMFGLMHWGVSVGVLAALPVSMLIGLGSVAWGKAVLDTNGLGYVIIAHTMIDICIMSAIFI